MNYKLILVISGFVFSFLLVLSVRGALRLVFSLLALATATLQLLNLLNYFSPPIPRFYLIASLVLLAVGLTLSLSERKFSARILPILLSVAAFLEIVLPFVIR